ncbi:ion channel protein [Isoptericola hypogeus]|uniref:Ion channel protein n=1 Tax=Isoptericola hypogeus TaxID=300179 RepID=A0ABN2IN71_9MICO
MTETPAAPTTTRALLRGSVPALGVGVGSALTLVALSGLAAWLQQRIWHDLPASWGVPQDSPWWTVAVLTVTGVLVGAVVRWVPGHAGNDPATSGLVAPPLPAGTVPGLALALVLGLAGGVSLGPENPIIAINVALAVWLLARPGSGTAAAGPVGLATAGTIGAMFGTPVAAVLVLTEALAEHGRGEGRLFDRLFGPLVAAGAGALTMQLIGAPTFSVDVAPYGEPRLWDIVAAVVVATCAALLAYLAVLSFAPVHRAFHLLRSPVLALGLAGLVLGALGAIGGPLTLFKGLDEMKELAERADELGWLALLGIAAVKTVALVVASGAGFRGGRIFPAVFIGVAVGLAASGLVPAVPAAVAVAAGVLGAVLVVARSGWLALFMAVVTVGDIALLPVLCLAVAPVWLAVRAMPEMLLPAAGDDRPEFAALSGAGPKHPA